jgi:hypothetical protein
MASLPHCFEEPGDEQDVCLVVDTIPTFAWSTGPVNGEDFGGLLDPLVYACVLPASRVCCRKLSQKTLARGVVLLGWGR